MPGLEDENEGSARPRIDKGGLSRLSQLVLAEADIAIRGQSSGRGAASSQDLVGSAAEPS
jgi:hypothetical protein